MCALTCTPPFPDRHVLYSYPGSHTRKMKCFYTEENRDHSLKSNIYKQLRSPEVYWEVFQAFLGGRTALQIIPSSNYVNIRWRNVTFPVFEFVLIPNVKTQVFFRDT